MATDTKTPNGTEAPAAPPAETTAIAPRAETAPATRPPVEFDADDPVALYMNPGVFEMVQRVAKLMAAAGTVPAHLREKIADCFLVAAQAFRWRMDPFAVAQHTFVVSGKLGYEGKLVAAVINSHKRIDRKLSYAYSGEGANRKVVVSGRLRGESEDRTVEGTLAQWATSNEQWKQSPDQMLAYRGARTWARRHAPEILLGVSTEEDLDKPLDLRPTGPGTYAAPADGGTALDALTERVAERTAAERAAAEPAEPAKHSDAEPAPKPTAPAEPEPDPNTAEGNPFLRGQEQVRKARRGQGSLTE